MKNTTSSRVYAYKSGANDITTPETLSKDYCQENFKLCLRNDGPRKEVGSGPAFVNPVPKKRREQISHVFTGEPEINQNQKRTRKYQPIESNVMFNDAYVETNPKINNKMKARYQFEKKIKENNNHLYSDELHICPEKLNSLNRKIKDNYECNPIPVLNEQDIKKMSDDNYKKNQKRCENIKGYTNSNALKGLFNYNNEQFESDKIINHKPIVNNINKDNVSYGKKSFKFCAARNGGYSYM